MTLARYSEDFFNIQEPILRRKQEALDVQDRCGLWRIRWQVSQRILFSGFYTRIDQAFLLWAMITGTIFCSAQYLPLDWRVQACIWSPLTVIGTLIMVTLTHFWVRVERLRWVLYFWVALMLSGLLLTNLSIFLVWGTVLSHLCPLWLSLSALGYLVMGLGLRSRTFLLNALFHLLIVGLLPAFDGFQFVVTGIVMASSLLLLAEVQWDMRAAIDDLDVLTPEEIQINLEQRRLRQLS